MTNGSPCWTGSTSASLQPEQVAPAPDLVTADLSFISLGLVLPALIRCASPDADFVLLVKPQFEVGKDRVGTGGVVRDPGLRREAVETVAAAAAELGLGVAGLVASPLPGPAGNVEYFLWLRRGAPPLRADGLRPGDRGGTTVKRTVLVVAHAGRPAALRSARLVVDRLTAAGMNVRVLAPEAAALKCAGADVVPAAPDAAAEAEMVIVLGGDGTLLRAAEMARPAATPMLGVNLGHVGFLAEAEPDDLAGAVDQVVEHRYSVEERMTVDVTVRHNGTATEHLGTERGERGEGVPGSG